MSEQLIIAGFHRSGTSATAQLLHRAGLFLGDELLEALPSNPYGHFEDREVVELHQAIFADNDLTWAVGEPFLPLITPERWEAMRRFVEARNAAHALWGFKDPRSCLFMAPWKYLMPDAKVLLVYRHFSATGFSLLQRHSSDLFLGRGQSLVHRRFFQEPDLPLKMWLTHNRALLGFARAYPQDTMTVSMGMIRDGFPLTWAINERWNLGLADVPPSEVYDPRVTAAATRRQPVSDRALIPAVTETWARLEALSRETERMILPRKGAPREEAAVAG